MKTLSVFGLGRVGLVFAVCLAKKGYRVIGIDHDKERLEQIRRAEPPFFEPLLPEYLKDAVESGCLVVTDNSSLNSESEVCFIAVGTPSKPDGGIDLGAIGAVARSIGRSSRGTSRDQLVVVRSTVVPGTTRGLVKASIEKESGKLKGRGFRLCSNPEFFHAGRAIHDTESPDRIIIGGDPEDAGTLEAFYREYYEGRVNNVMKTTYENAEFIKYAVNAFIAVKVSFINNIANIAEQVPHADIKAVAAGVGLDTRIGLGALNAGLGWGGDCLPKDLDALIRYSEELGIETDVLRATRKTNLEQPRKSVQIAAELLGSVKKKKVAVLGLAFKPGTDNMARAVSVPIIRSLLAKGANVVAHDPEAAADAQRILGDKVEYAKDAIACITQAEAVIIVTEWDEYKGIRPETFLKAMKRPNVIDGRRIYDPSSFIRAGIQFRAIGLGPDS